MSSKSSTNRTFAWLAVVSALGSWPLARAADTTPPPDAVAAARTHLNRGHAHYDLQEWDEAIKDYKAGYLLDPRPEFLWAIAQSQRQSGDCKSAIGSYRAFLRTHPTPGQESAADARISECQNALDAKSAPAASASGTASAGSSPSTAATVASPLPPRRQQAPIPPTVPSSRYVDPLGHTLFWSGVVVAGASAFVLVWANREVSSAPTAATYGDALAQSNRARPWQAAGVTGLVTGGLLSALGALRFATVDLGSAHVEPVVTGDRSGASFFVVGAF